MPLTALSSIEVSFYNTRANEIISATTITIIAIGCSVIFFFFIFPLSY